MKIAIAQLNYHIGNFELNKKKIICSIKKAEKRGADLIIFSELCVCGYPPRDFLEFDDFINKSIDTVNEIARSCGEIACILGAPSRNSKLTGKRLFNSAYFIQKKTVYKIVHKTLLPTYDVFDEYRYFEPNDFFEIVKYKSKKIAITICEDIWNTKSGSLYKIEPLEQLSKQKPDFIVNISASPFDYCHREIRHKIMKENVSKYKIPLIYVNHVGAQTELIFDGGSCIVNPDGSIHKEMKFFKEDFAVVDLKETSGNRVIGKLKYERIYEALILGIRDYFSKQGFSKAILGLSGGIDSALCLTLLVHALGKENVLALMMSSRFSSKHSISDSEELINILSCQFEKIPINTVVNQYEKSLKPFFSGTERGIAEENLQARARAAFLLALSNKHGYILINTSNKSEIATGFGTLYGDMCGGLSIIGDLYKTDVYQLCKFINGRKKIIPTAILQKSPSAELRPNQKDSDSLPEYELLDKILYHYIEMKTGPKEIIDLGFNKEIVNRVLKLVNTTEWKRYQTPPVLRVSPKAFGMGRRMPIVAKYI